MSSYRIANIGDARREAARLKQELDDMYSRYLIAVSLMPIDFQGDVHKYVCIRLAGYLEQLFYVLLTGSIKTSVTSHVSNFALSNFKYAPNMKPQNLERLIRNFSEDWGDTLTVLLDDASRREQLGSLLEVRNKTAHGQSYSGSAPQTRSYKQLVDELHNWAIRTIV